MAAGDITVKITISGTVVSGKAIRNTSESITFASISDVIDRHITCPSGTEITVLLIASTVGGGTIAALNCVTFHNTSTTITVEVGFIENGVQSVYFNLAPDEAKVMMGSDMIVSASGASSATFADIDKITLQALTGTAVVEMVAF